MQLLKWCGSLALLFTIRAMADEPGQPAYSIVERGLDHRVMRRVQVATNESGRIITRTNSYTEMQTGMHFEQDGQLVEANAEIELIEGGAAGRNTRHKVTFSADVNNWNGTVNLLTSDNKRFRSRVLGLSYWDTQTGQSVLIAELKDSIGVLSPDKTQITYEDAFTDFRADVRYRNYKSGLEQDVIIMEQPPAPGVYGLNPETTRLQVLTEFFEAPVPAKEIIVQGGVSDHRVLNFGRMRIGVGKGFMAADEHQSAIVEKEWVNLENRDFLIEQLPYENIDQFLNTLPASPQANLRKAGQIRHLVSKERLLPERQTALIQRKDPVQIASVPREKAGFVLDYWMVSSQSNVTFQADTTYCVGGVVNLAGKTVFEGGSVLKFTNGAKLQMGTNEFQTDAYRPAVFTSMHDDSAGESIAGSSGDPWAAFCGDGLHITSYGSNLRYARFSYLNKAVTFEGNSNTNTISHSQFVRCELAMDSIPYDDDFHTLKIRNALFYSIGTFLDNSVGGLESVLDAQHLTVNECNVFNSAEDANIALTNSLLVAITNFSDVALNPVYSNQVITLANSTGVFQVAGAADHYLSTNSSYRNTGTTSISADLLKDLSTKTTFAPMVVANAVYTNNVTLSQAVYRDDDGLPDIGYHYDPLDFLFCDARIVGATVTLTNGVAVGFYAVNSPWGACVLENWGYILSEGKASNPNHLVWYNTVQERGNPAWTTIALGNYPDMVVSDSSPAGLSFEFTRISRLADGWRHIGQGDAGWAGSINLSNSEFYGGGLALTAVGSFIIAEFQGHLNNCLFVRSPVWCLTSGLDYYGSINHSLFKGSSIIVEDGDPGSGVFDFETANNLFDEVTISQIPPVTSSYNAYWNCSTNFTPVGAGSLILTNPIIYETGSLGMFYHPTNSALYNMGSTNANLIGFYHFTTTTNQTKETNSVIDIGYHYVAVNNQGQPLDTDDDGVPDYLEDSNGNGNNDLSENEWDLGLEIWITAPKANSNLP